SQLFGKQPCASVKDILPPGGSIWSRQKSFRVGHLTKSVIQQRQSAGLLFSMFGMKLFSASASLKRQSPLLTFQFDCHKVSKVCFRSRRSAMAWSIPLISGVSATKTTLAFG